jgi:putative ABC transport system ATP-binding protein
VLSWYLIIMMSSTHRSTPGSPLVVMQGVSKVFPEGNGERVVFRGLDAVVRGNAISAVLGRSGSGKTTLLNLIAGIELPAAGEVMIGGVCITSLPERERTLFRRDHIGFVFQFYNLIPTLTVEENVLLPLDLAGRNGGPARRKALSLLSEVGLADRRGSWPDRLSGGEQQRVAVVRALVHDPLLVLADEPTGNLDAEAGRQVLDMLERLVRRAGATLILATHSEEVVRLADHILRIRDGRLVEEAPPWGAPE